MIFAQQAFCQMVPIKPFTPRMSTRVRRRAVQQAGYSSVNLAPGPASALIASLHSNAVARLSGDDFQRAIAKAISSGATEITLPGCAAGA